MTGRAFADNPRGKITGESSRASSQALSYERWQPEASSACMCIGRANEQSELVHIGQGRDRAWRHRRLSYIQLVFNYPTLSDSEKYAAYDCPRRAGAARVLGRSSELIVHSSSGRADSDGAQRSEPFAVELCSAGRGRDRLVASWRVTDD